MYRRGTILGSYIKDRRFFQGGALWRRFNSHANRREVDRATFDVLNQESSNTGKQNEDDVLPFSRRRHSESFGQLSRHEHLRQKDKLKGNDENLFVKTDEQGHAYSPFRKEDGSFIKGRSAEEARIDGLTLKGRVERGTTQLPSEIAESINNDILRYTKPDRLRERAALLFQSLKKEQIQKAPESGLDCDAHIAALFLQDYSHTKQVLLELQKRVGKDKFYPQRVLSVGYGPATGMVALNEVMGDEYQPLEKEAYIVSPNNKEMKKKAKIILSRQINENVTSEEEGAVAEGEEEEVPEEKEVEGVQADREYGFESDFESEAWSEEDKGPVDTSKILTRTRIRDTLPVSKSYDLIIVCNSLLSRVYNFPKDVDNNTHMLLRLLSPGGHLAIIQRGNALGFETVARARQIMIRPEAYPLERGKIPRPYIKGATVKPQKSEEINRQAQGSEDRNLEEVSSAGDGFLEELDKIFGQVKESDLKFEFEDDENYELKKTEESEKKASTSSRNTDYHIKILAPCPHHGKCPLQLGDPAYYKIPSHSHRLNFCSFTKTSERPKYTMELKKGRRLALGWDPTAEDGFGLDKISRNKLKSLAGSGRPGSNNMETGSFSYIIAERSYNDKESIKNIEEVRTNNGTNELDPLTADNWPRILENPQKVKKNVKFNVCSPTSNIEVWQVPKSSGKQTYYDARKAAKGDLWALGAKSIIRKNPMSEKNKEKLENLARAHKKKLLKEERKKKLSKLVSSSEEDFEDDPVSYADFYATSLENTKKYKQKGKKAGYAVNLKQYEDK